MKECTADKPEIPLTKGKQKRDFIYIDDAVSAYEVLLRAHKSVKTGYSELEVGSGATVTIRRFAEMIKKISGSKTVLGFGKVPYRKNEAMCLKANIRKISALGWEPKISLEDGIRMVITQLRGSRNEEIGTDQ